MSAKATAHLGDVASFVRGITFKPDDIVPVGSDGTVACMRTKNVQSDLDLSDVWGIPDSFVKRNDQYLTAGDLLVSSANSWNLVGKCCWVPELPWRATFGGFISVLRGDRQMIIPRYLYHWFASSPIQATVRTFGQKTTNISNLNFDRCLRLPIHLPSLPEQERIAEILDKAGALRARRRAALAQLGTLIQSIFLDMFGDPATNPKAWQITPLGELMSFGPQNGLYRPANEYGSGTQILRIDGFYDGIVTGMATLKRVRISGEDVALYGLRPGDIVVNRVNSREYLGKSALIPNLPEPMVFESNMMRFGVDARRVDPVYLIQLLQTRHVRSHILRAAKDAVNQSSINQQDVKSIPIALPPLSQQERFGCVVQGIQMLADVHRSSGVQLDTLFASLKGRAFAGEL